MWRGDSRKRLQGYPKIARDRLGLELFRLQCGEMPLGSKPMQTVGRGVFEIRAHCEREYRVIYATILDSVVVLHAFIKKSQKTAPVDLRLAKERLREVLQEITYGTFD